ncbi:GyrI-like domain-containing protein [Chelatococcus asaccharovorans]|uniref:GyrI-like domain-containing protein n=1 Tax=Chelatococcus asaccharovorans TaxID=28210 RepID=UPI00224C67A6|nr:GyrI-like domain-containing protein [Chelatococcus asaccharovorans]CAH1657430.1 Effector-binding domain-containing protein [Chelatococcus asaccharovorans]CAH1684795.1 Effector-binding domain-containing protein [Chelatococcus asaccharovorans]
MMGSRALGEVTISQIVPRPGARHKARGLGRSGTSKPVAAWILPGLVMAALLVAATALSPGAFAQGGAQPPATSSPAPAPADGSPAASRAAEDLPALVPLTGNSGDAEDVMLPEKPAAVLRGGESTWDDGFKNLTESFARIQDALAKAGLKPAGRPLAVFLSADDTHFRFEAMVPLAAPFPGGGEIAPGITAGVTPSGRALRFVHKAPYDEIDTTYEAITAYLDQKNMVAKDAFIEEYSSRTMDPDDPDLEINVYVQPK